MPRRNSDRHSDELGYVTRDPSLLLSTEILRNTATVGPHKPEEKISVFWRVFGGTLLSISALVVIQAYQSLASNIHDLRTELARMHEFQADFVKKDDFNSRTTSLWNRVQDLQSLNAAISVTGNKMAAVEQQLTVAERDRKEIQAAVAALAPFKDRLDEQKKAADSDHKEVITLGAALNAVREKDLLLEKQLRESEGERKDFIRELQALRERLAKLEGTKAVPDSK
ncbi:MAG: hypothetical protein ACJ8C4_08400 [Gemmataceae bacterium]